MGADAFSAVFFGTFLAIVAIVVLVVVSRGLKKRLFPSETEAERSEAMAELLLLQAELQKRASEESDQRGIAQDLDPGEKGGESEGSPGVGP